MTPAEKMAARLNGTTKVTSYEPSLPESVPDDHTSPEARIRSKQARHALEQEQKRAAMAKTERKAEVAAAPEKPPEPKPEEPVAKTPSEPPRDNRDQHRNRR